MNWPRAARASHFGAWRAEALDVLGIADALRLLCDATDAASLAEARAQLRAAWGGADLRRLSGRGDHVLDVRADSFDSATAERVIEANFNWRAAPDRLRARRDPCRAWRHRLRCQSHFPAFARQAVTRRRPSANCASSDPALFGVMTNKNGLTGARPRRAASA